MAVYERATLSGPHLLQTEDSLQMGWAQRRTESGSERVRQLASLWRTVQGRPQHPAGCSCMAHFLVPTMNATDLENDIVDYLRGRYASEGLIELVRILDQRLAEHDAGSPAPFRTWLLRLPEREVGSAALDRLLTDLHSTLTSFEPPNSSQGDQGSFVCY